MQRIRTLIVLAAFSVVASIIVAEMKTPSLTVMCAECGDGPKDKKCPEGQKCVNSKCVKK
jgi:hypothetical protein